jgi:hypothetical protein
MALNDLEAGMIWGSNCYLDLEIEYLRKELNDIGDPDRLDVPPSLYVKKPWYTLILESLINGIKRFI